MIHFSETHDKNKVKFTGSVKNFQAEIVNVDGQEVKKLTGLAIVYDQLSDDRGGYKVRIKAGAARFTDPVLALYDHNYAQVLGNTKNGTLSLVDGPDGISVEILLPDTSLGNDIYQLVKNGYISGMSFGTIPVKVNKLKEDGQSIHEYTEMLVDEVTITVIPAFKATSIDAKYNAELSSQVIETPAVDAEPDPAEAIPDDADVPEVVITDEALEIAKAILWLLENDEVGDETEAEEIISE